MRRWDKAWEIRLRTKARGTTIRHRNRPMVAGLTASTVLLAMAGLIADLRLGSCPVTLACYGAAVVSGIVLLAFLFNRRLWVSRPPER